MKRVGGFTDALIASVTAAFFLCVIVPLQTYCGNPGVFDFGLARLLVELLLMGMVVATPLFLTLLASGKLMGRIPHIVLLAFVTYEYLATGVLTIGFPSLDGESFFYANTARRLIDCCVFIGIVSLALICFRWVKKSLTFWSLGLLVMMFASLFDVNTAKIPEASDIDSPFSGGFAPRVNVIQSAYFSPNRNVLVFVLDSTTTEVFCDLLMHETEIGNEFTGFTVYTNNIGMLPNTSLGIPGLLTGCYYDGSCSFGEYISSCFSNKSLLETYRANDVPMFASLGCFDRFGYSNRLKRSKDGSTDGERSGLALLRRIGGTQAWNLFEIAGFRLTPFILKTRVLHKIMANWDAYQDMEEEKAVYSMLASAEISNSDNLTFHIYHTAGCHVPYTTDRHGCKCDKAEGYRGSYEKACFALSELSKLFIVLKQRGIYDKSLIVVTADHGNYDAKRESIGNVDLQKNSIVNRAFPCMAVKPESGCGEVMYDETPTSHIRIKALLEKAAVKKLTSEEIGSVLRTSGERLFRVPLKGSGDDWIFTADGSIRHEPFIPQSDAKKLLPIKIGKEYSLNNTNVKIGSLPPIFYEGIDGSYVAAPLSRTNHVSMKFRVDDIHAAYSAELVLRYGVKQGCVKEHAGTISLEGSHAVQLTGRDGIKVKTSKLIPNDDGVVTIAADISDGFEVLFYSIRVNKL